MSPTPPADPFKTAAGPAVPQPSAKLKNIVAARDEEIREALLLTPTALLTDGATAFFVTRAEAADVPLLLHAHPGELEFGVLAEHRFPILSVVASLATSGGPRYAGFTVDIGSPLAVRRFEALLAQPHLDLAVLDPAGRFAVAHRFEIPLWSRAAGRRALDQARSHLLSIPPGIRSYERAREEFLAWCQDNISA